MNGSLIVKFKVNTEGIKIISTDVMINYQLNEHLIRVSKLVPMNKY